MRVLFEGEVMMYPGSLHRVSLVQGEPIQAAFLESQERIERWLVPGFVDQHIHGAFDIDMMDADTAAMAELADRLAEEGYESFLPTTITAPFEQVKAAVEALPEHPLIAGFHLEGPFISPEYPGAQPPEFILDPPTGPGEWDWVFDHPKLKKITLAPERPGALNLIRRLNARGVIVSMGHSNATYAEAAAGFEAGAASVTHTFNAMRPFHHREPGLVGLAIGESGLSLELIYDRHHVSKGAAKTLCSLNVVAVSDASRAARMPDGPVTMWGHECTVSEGTVRLNSNGALAGSTALLSDVFRNRWEDLGPRKAVSACCINPRQRLGNPATRTWLLVEGGRVVERYVLD